MTEQTGVLNTMIWLELGGGQRQLIRCRSGAMFESLPPLFGERRQNPSSTSGDRREGRACAVPSVRCLE